MDAATTEHATNDQATGTAAAAWAAGLTRRYNGVSVVDAIDLEVRRGECFALLGPNGAGKTTTLRMLLGLTPPSDGEIRVLGEPIPLRAREMRQRAGIVPQFDNLDPDFTVRENLITYGTYFGLPRAHIEARMDTLLGFAELRERAHSPIQALSGGMKRRLTLARALVNDPELLVLDEPTTGLDPQARQHIWERLHHLRREGRTLLLTTHYMEEAERLCDRAAIIDGGRIVACDSPTRLIETHIEPHVVELRGDLALTWSGRERDTTDLRVENVGETVLVYGPEREPLLRRVEAEIGPRYLYRPASLEDVFLKLTGRELRD
ncbi:ATP-binding cassette domain-containing protein [Spiribacter halobius]|uniref:ABC transporter n=1 Tax=Sediminicurvatus halobius TaxID=2182432 RepID=A0A2U2N1T1_9GAMM|nr:ATP-binding cassette domain-containing protein [Spiribacter halobius]PWG62934.1 ABC transporter [Spiribacter halobius]UEX77445.1 ATP-binding cassette domain-containing protein [Spiribacter halobius]